MAFFYLSKKVAVPNGAKIATLAFNPEHGWLACGAENGLLKVLRLDAAAGKDAPVGPGGVRGIAASANLSMNHTLEGHNGKRWPRLAFCDPA
jgi:WD repeat-containing protein 35